MARKKRAVPFKENMNKFEFMTESQRRAGEAFAQGKNLILDGYAGTGKTFLSMNLALQAIMDPDSPYREVVIIRSAEPTQDLGALPGTFEEKIAPFQEPYDSICDEIFKVRNTYDELKERGYLTFMPVSFIRGVTISDAIIIVDECQNLNFHQLDSVITRVGETSRIIFSGDYTQSDLRKQKDKEGILRFFEIIDKLNHFERIDFDERDIVRGELVKDYIIKKHELGYTFC